jgi:hypothetical protein
MPSSRWERGWKGNGDVAVPFEPGIAGMGGFPASCRG